MGLGYWDIGLGVGYWDIGLGQGFWDIGVGLGFCDTSLGLDVVSVWVGENFQETTLNGIGCCLVLDSVLLSFEMFFQSSSTWVG